MYSNVTNGIFIVNSMAWYLSNLDLKVVLYTGLPATKFSLSITCLRSENRHFLVLSSLVGFVLLFRKSFLLESILLTSDTIILLDMAPVSMQMKVLISRCKECVIVFNYSKPPLQYRDSPPLGVPGA